MTISNLLANPAGQLAIREATADMLRKRIRRWFERNTVIGFDNWVLNGKPSPIMLSADFLGVLDSLNAVHDKEILDLLDALQQLEGAADSLDLNWYVDTVNGDDVTGDGSTLHPYKSLTKVQDIYGPVWHCNSQVNIYCNAPAANPIALVRDWQITCGPAAQITIQGANAPTVISAGPHAVSGFTDLGVSAVMGHDIAVAAPSWVPNAQVGNFIHMLTGTRTGRFYCIVENTADHLWISYTDEPFAIADTFEIVRPGSVLASTIPFSISIEGLQDYKQTYISRFTFANLVCNSNFNICHVNAGFDFDFFACDHTMKSYRSCGSFMNLCTFINPTVFSNANWITGKSGRSWISAIWMETLNWLSSRWLCCNTITLNHKAADFAFDHGSAKLVNCYQGTLILQRSIVPTTATDFVAYTANEQLLIDGIYLLGCRDVIRCVNEMSKVHITNIEGAAAPSGYTIRISVLSVVSIKGVNIIGGTLNDLYWDFTAAAAAFPAAGTSITDANGAFCVAE